ncbi:MAG: hypothetical protein NTW29_02865 [Bacteroidetes bacterium]|nr:hypothetical protein [Bacteroidota bacterium]
MKSYKERLESLQEHRPSIIRNSILVFVYRTLFGLIGMTAFILGVAMIINAAVGQNIISFIIDKNKENTTPDTYKSLGMLLGLLLILTGIISFFIYSLAGKVSRRNSYIMDLEDLTTEMIDESETKDIPEAQEEEDK